MLDNQPTADDGVKETRHERFLRLAPLRVQNALHALDIVSKLATPQNEYTREEATRLVEALRQRVDEIERLMLNKGEERKPFSFD